MRSLRLKEYALLFLLFATTFATSAQVEIKGVVKDDFGFPIPHVLISFGTDSYEFHSNQNGTFNLTLSNTTNQTLLFQHQLYKNEQLSLNKIGRNDSIVVQLHRKETLLDEVVVTSKTNLTTSSIYELKNSHKQIAGGTSIAEMHPENQRLETLKDALRYQPGVIVQEFFGANDQPRINIRGSGIQSNPQRRGVYFMEDGIPMNFSDGSFISGVLDPITAQNIEILKGANGMQMGSATLGGTLNFLTRNGKNSPNLMLKSEAGSHHYHSFTAMGGGTIGKFDAYATMAYSNQKGFRQYNKNRKMSMTTNLGYQINENIENRTYLNYSYIKFDSPGTLTLDMIKEDPTQISKGVQLPNYMGPNVERDKPGREATIFRVANRIGTHINANWDFIAALYYQYADDRFVFPIVISTQHSYYHDAGFSASLKFWKAKHRFTIGLMGSYGYIDRRGHINKNGEDSFLFSKDGLTALNGTLFLEENYELNSHLSLIANLQLAYNKRDSKDNFENPELRPWYSHSSDKYRYFYSADTSFNRHYTAINPRIGLIYNVKKDKSIQLFTNLSTSYEPPTFEELVGTAVTENINTSPKKLFTNNLNKQSSTTFEIGTRGSFYHFNWNLSLYNSWVKNELLEVKDFVMGVKETKNYPNTIHMGIEFGFSVIPLESIFSKSDRDIIVIEGTYNYTDFHFSTGEYKGSKLAGIPRHYLAASVKYEYPNRGFIEMNVESQPIKTAIDHVNTMYQPSYTIWGAKIGVQFLKKFSAYVEVKNLFNRHYASSYIVSDEIHNPPIPFPNFTAKNLALFIPGPTRAYYLGVTYKL